MPACKGITYNAAAPVPGGGDQMYNIYLKTSALTQSAAGWAAYVVLASLFWKPF
jgi:hypothetical protein